jgi:acetyltransferase-like isoleucine patch superfamily enzyme
MPFPCTILVDQAKATVVVGNHSRLNGAYVHAQASILIGKNCVIAAGVNIIDSNGHELLSPNRTTGRDRPEPIEIGENVWIGINAIVLKGTRVGNNSVIGANSVVSGNFPENSLIVGNPARLVKQLDIPLCQTTCRVVL